MLVVMTGALAAVVAGISAINVLDVFFVRDTLHGSTTISASSPPPGPSAC